MLPSIIRRGLYALQEIGKGSANGSRVVRHYWSRGCTKICQRWRSHGPRGHNPPNSSVASSPSGKGSQTRRDLYLCKGGIYSWYRPEMLVGMSTLAPFLHFTYQHLSSSCHGIRIVTLSSSSQIHECAMHLVSSWSCVQASASSEKVRLVSLLRSS